MLQKHSMYCLKKTQIALVIAAVLQTQRTVSSSSTDEHSTIKKGDYIFHEEHGWAFVTQTHPNGIVGPDGKVKNFAFSAVVLTEKGLPKENALNKSLCKIYAQDGDEKNWVKIIDKPREEIPGGRLRGIYEYQNTRTYGKVCGYCGGCRCRECKNDNSHCTNSITGEQLKKCKGKGECYEVAAVATGVMWLGFGCTATGAAGLIASSLTETDLTTPSLILLLSGIAMLIGIFGWLLRSQQNMFGGFYTCRNCTIYKPKN